VQERGTSRPLARPELLQDNEGLVEYSIAERGDPPALCPCLELLQDNSSRGGDDCETQKQKKNNIVKAKLFCFTEVVHLCKYVG
jgi:hypothetical protein